MLKYQVVEFHNGLAISPLFDSESEAAEFAQETLKLPVTGSWGVVIVPPAGTLTLEQAVTRKPGDKLWYLGMTIEGQGCRTTMFLGGEATVKRNWWNEYGGAITITLPDGRTAVIGHSIEREDQKGRGYYKAGPPSLDDLVNLLDQMVLEAQLGCPTKDMDGGSYRYEPVRELARVEVIAAKFGFSLAQVEEHQQKMYHDQMMADMADAGPYGRIS